MPIFLDSNIVVDAIKHKVTLKNTSYYINPIVYAEVLYGLLYIGKSENEFQRFLESIGIEVLTISTETASIYTKLKLEYNKKGFPLADNDLLIAASCLEHSLSLFTLNLRHFERIRDLKSVSEA
jgi:predicted nucleic acid-binding protein